MKNDKYRGIAPAPFPGLELHDSDDEAAIRDRIRAAAALDHEALAELEAIIAALSAPEEFK
jgi:hypothetical protein